MCYVYDGSKPTLVIVHKSHRWGFISITVLINATTRSVSKNKLQKNDYGFN